MRKRAPARTGNLHRIVAWPTTARKARAIRKVRPEPVGRRKARPPSRAVRKNLQSHLRRGGDKKIKSWCRRPESPLSRDGDRATLWRDTPTSGHGLRQRFRRSTHAPRWQLLGYLMLAGVSYTKRRRSSSQARSRSRPMQLRGRVALVTGTASGLCRGHARDCALRGQRS
jgi:hypothetical protein